MSHDIDMSNGRANIAFMGDRNDIWHRLGTAMVPGQSQAEWLKAAGLDWRAVKVPAYMETAPGKFDRAGDRHFIMRDDTRAMLGKNVVTDVYQIVQPAELDAWFEQYIAVDDRFARDVMGSLDGGSTIWGTATFREPVTVAGDAHIMRILMSTTFDGSGSTINQTCSERVVCRNTLRIAHGERGNAIIRTRHNTKFNAERVGAELAELAQSIAQFKKLGDAMAQVTMTKADVSAFFKACLEIPADAKPDDISTRKMNQFSALSTAFQTTRRERNASPDSPIDVWTALQSVTRYVDHDRINGDEKSFTSATFGSGDTLKGRAMALLMPRVRNLIPA